MDKLEGLKKKIKTLPGTSGVYIMKNKHNEIIYCGKAISLKKRVASYFNQYHILDQKRAGLLSEVEDIEYIITKSEFEALILESNLIKRHKPKYNVLLRDDKQYPHICITINEPFPRIKVVRRIKRDKCLYFGPYTPVKAMRNTLRLIHEIFPIRHCSNPITGRRKRPCLNYQMGICCAPCCGNISQQAYKGLIDEILLFFQGKRDDLIKKLNQKMEEAANEHEFEEAAKIRDNIKALQSFLEKQYVFTDSFKDQDFFAFVRNEGSVFAEVFFIRYGKLVGSKSLQIFEAEDTPDHELMGIILKQFYGDDKTIPSEVLVQTMPNDIALIRQWLSEKRGTKVNIIKPKKGQKKELMIMASQNAYYKAISAAREGPQENGHNRLLQQIEHDLALPRLPSRIEGFDISNLGSSEAVGAMVFWMNGVPVKRKYRRFKIKDIGGIDDYAMMGQVITRRYSRLIRENEALPDLILIDGGKGHLTAGLKALEGLGIRETLPVISLAKRDELIYTPQSDTPINLPKHSNTLRLLQRIRDEAHRFAISYQKVRRKRHTFSSTLDNIKGVGPKRKDVLLQYFSGIEGIKRASAQELTDVPGIDKQTAENIYSHFHNGSNFTSS